LRCVHKQRGAGRNEIADRYGGGAHIRRAAPRGDRHTLANDT